MKKMIATLAIAGLGATLAAGAQAQTVTGTGGTGSYAVTFMNPPTPTVTGPVAGDYTYTYTVTGFTNTTGANVTSVVFSGIAGYDGGASQTGFGGGAPTVTTAGGATTLAFNGGSVAVGSAFTFLDLLPPTATVGIVASGNAGGGTVNTGVKTLGPGTAVPEAGSFALLGLGLLPLAFVARRRISRQA